MEYLLATTSTGATTSPTLVLSLPQHWPGQSDLLTWCDKLGPAEACLLVILGLVCLLFGYAIFRGIVVLNAMAVGAYLGAMLGKDPHSLMMGAFIGAVVAAAITLPLMKYAVTIMGACFGAALGASLWNQAGLQQELAWAGALSGLILLGMLSLIVFRGSVIMLTSIQGAVMLVLGVIALCYEYPWVATAMKDAFVHRAFLLPSIILVPTLFGLLYQQAMYPAAPPQKK